jgi:hypothetical protein
MKVFSFGVVVKADSDVKLEILMVQGSISESVISGSRSATSYPSSIYSSCLNGMENMGGPIFVLKASSRLFIIKENPADVFYLVEPSVASMLNK